jgi:hypothetical protein
MAEPFRDPIPGFDSHTVGIRIKGFLHSRSENPTLANEQGFNTGVSSVVRYLVAEILKNASQVARDTQRKITPSDIRASTQIDKGFGDMLSLSRMYW